MSLCRGQKARWGLQDKRMDFADLDWEKMTKFVDSDRINMEDR
jgi:hypothetical protein